MEEYGGLETERQATGSADGVERGMEHLHMLWFLSPAAPGSLLAHFRSSGVKKIMESCLSSIYFRRISNVAFYYSSLVWWSLDVQGYRQSTTAFRVAIVDLAGALLCLTAFSHSKSHSKLMVMSISTLLTWVHL